MNIVFERAEKKDISQLIKVQKLSFREEFIQHGECAPYNEKAKDIEHLIENHIVYKIIIDEEIIGDMVIIIKSKNFYYLKIIAVIPNYQNLGIGKKALDFMEKDNPNATLWRLITSKDNKKNCHFYESMGYKSVREIIRKESFDLVNYEKIID